MQFIDHPLLAGLYSRPYGCAPAAADRIAKLRAEARDAEARNHDLWSRVTSCAFCGRENEPDSRFCIHCGKPMNPSAARVGPAYVAQPFGGQPQPVSPPAVATRPAAASF